LFRIVELKEDPYYWYLALAILILAFEAVFTLTIKVITKKISQQIKQD
jgi:ABC-type arginine transport system permease subunit